MKKIPSISRFSGYRAMWLFVFYDLPTETKKDRRNFQQFRLALMKDGFAMHQYSVYVRHCASAENADVHEQEYERLYPKKVRLVF